MWLGREVCPSRPIRFLAHVSFFIAWHGCVYTFIRGCCHHWPIRVRIYWGFLRGMSKRIKTILSNCLDNKEWGFYVETYCGQFRQPATRDENKFFYKHLIILTPHPLPLSRWMDDDLGLLARAGLCQYLTCTFYTFLGRGGGHILERTVPYQFHETTSSASSTFYFYRF